MREWTYSSTIQAPAALLTENRASGTHWIGIWVGPSVGANAMEQK
jgi:hypothetical protein